MARPVRAVQKPLIDTTSVELHLVRSSKNFHVYGASTKEIIANDIYVHHDVVGKKAPDSISIQLVFPAPEK